MRAPDTQTDTRATSAQGGVTPRPTVTITGRGAERGLPPDYRAARRRSLERGGRRPDRVALWAVLLGVALAIIAATSSHAAVLAHIAHAAAR
jgi:hypothetical protein